ncbi:uncharacterized protein TNCV_1601891 [Trichonephila clavipes]|nr:uncharacterized protein TNCV_1601891 [Trichonephila clavipes]
MIMDVPIAPSSAYCILKFVSVFAAVSETVISKTCKNDLSFSQSSFRGLGLKIILWCNCEERTVINSCPMIQNACEINRWCVFVMQLFGVGYEGVDLFCRPIDTCSTQIQCTVCY